MGVFAAWQKNKSRPSTIYSHFEKKVHVNITISHVEIDIWHIKISNSHVEINKSHVIVNIVMLDIDINKSHFEVIMLQIACIISDICDSAQIYKLK